MRSDNWSRTQGLTLSRCRNGSRRPPGPYQPDGGSIAKASCASRRAIPSRSSTSCSPAAVRLVGLWRLPQRSRFRWTGFVLQHSSRHGAERHRADAARRGRSHGRAPGEPRVQGSRVRAADAWIRERDTHPAIIAGISTCPPTARSNGTTGAGGPMRSNRLAPGWGTRNLRRCGASVSITSCSTATGSGLSGVGPDVGPITGR